MTTGEVPVLVAVEDALSEAVARRMMQSLGMAPGQTFGLRGNRHLRRKARNLNEAARGLPIFLLTDQDVTTRCPPALIKGWLRSSRNPGLIFSLARRSPRRAVREDLVPPRGSTATVGPGYNERLVQFVHDEWSMQRAARVSRSLRKAVVALESLRDSGSSGRGQ